MAVASKEAETPIPANAERPSRQGVTRDSKHSVHPSRPPPGWKSPGASKSPSCGEKPKA
jgi:hypothetical protein